MFDSGHPARTSPPSWRPKAELSPFANPLSKGAIVNFPQRADMLRMLRLVSEAEPLLMLKGSSDGYGTRWILSGQQVEPAIVRFLVEHQFIVEAGVTELGARRMALTAAGEKFRADGIAWWAELGFLARLKVTLLG